MKLLIINPNTSTATNHRIENVAKPLMAPFDSLEVVSAKSGIEFIETIEQSNQTTSAVLEEVSKNSKSVDGIIIAAFSDPGLMEAKKLSSCPVIGIAEASMKVAQGLTERFAVITLGSQFSQLIRQHSLNYGVAENLVEIKILPWSVSEVSINFSHYKEGFAEACKKLISERDIGAVIVGGGPLSGIADAISGELPIPVLDGVRCAVDLTLKFWREQNIV